MSSYAASNQTPRFNTVAEAAQTQNAEAVIEMLNSGYNINAQDMDGNTALHWAVWFRLDSLAQQLMERQARPDLGNSSGESPVHWAAKSSNVLALDAMTKHDRGLISQRDCDGFTPFIISSQNDNTPIMEWMYLKGISVEEQDDWGRTALQWACYKGHRRTVQWLLSRSASVAHRDHEGMTAIHWAALKGHEQVAEMLIDVGAVQLLDVPDAAGDTPIALAQRKKNRYLVMCFHKCQLFFQIFGRPHLSHNHFANLFVAFILFNICVFTFIVAPGIFENHIFAVLVWAAMMGGSLALWVKACWSDPGWIGPKTILPQHKRIGRDPILTFDADQPVESQMIHAEENEELDHGSCESMTDELARLELEQNKFNYQRQLITEARRKLDETGGFNGGPGYVLTGAGTGGTELQPLMNEMDLGSVDANQPQGVQQRQLERASFALRERARATGENLGRERIANLLDKGRGEYVSLIDKGEFKQVCVVCRARREMRSHHCKECGRCVQRLDHHCPWIDNCVGLGNQRTFYCFIVSLLFTIADFYVVVVLYVFDEVIPSWTRSSIGQLWGQLTKFQFGPELQPLIVLVTAAFDLIWLAFVGALVARHTSYMIVNVTTYEVLVRPAHMQRRFPKSRGRFWFFNGCGPLRAVRNCVAYWVLDTTHDAGDFLAQATPMDSFVATSGDMAVAGAPHNRGVAGGTGAYHATPHYEGTPARSYPQDIGGGSGGAHGASPMGMGSGAGLYGPPPAAASPFGR